MFIVDLECCNGHQFEGWYDDRAEYEQIRADGDLTCPLCETDDVRRRLTTGAAKTSKTREKQERYNEIPDHEYEFVGRSFADRAIAMVEGRETPAPIAGFINDEDTERLKEKGVRHFPMGVVDTGPDPEDIH